MSDAIHSIGEAVPTRRDFLYRVAALGGLGLAMATMDAWGMGSASGADSPPLLKGSGKGKKVLILGAGIAGMTSAYELRKIGYECVVLEARDIAGGRARTARRGTRSEEIGSGNATCAFDDQDFFNLGPMRIPYHHRSTLHYTREFQIPLGIFVNDNDAAYVYHENAGALSGKRFRQGEIKADMRGHVNELIAKSIHTGKLDETLTAEDKVLLLDYLTHEGYLRADDLKYVGTNGRGYKVNPGAGMEPGPGEASDPLGFQEVLQSKLGKVYQSVQNFNQQVTMFHPLKGMDQIGNAFVQRLGNTIRFHTEVTKLRQDANGVTATIKDTHNGTTDTVQADFCICTIPLSVLRHIDTDFSEPVKAAIASVEYASAGKIGIQMKRRFWEEDDAIYGGHVRTDIKGIGTITLPSNNWQAKKGVVLGYYNFSKTAAEVGDSSHQERTELAVSGGQKIFPQYRENVESSFSIAWQKVPYSRGGWANWTPETRKSAYPLLLEPQGRVFLAGEHLSYQTGWISGAIESAWQQIGKLHQRATAS
ncbi:monoamine oxidase [Lampropedia hyalina DSM 16112]|uniref:Tryptophan 2-monooxygenase n=1 Tax=Lampropedia hyalina DSM 16112 TaxID=1122156 RepID=A0A1M4ZBA5_9BURK|nr:flavin monoamine oxidase family protein [Lampropedia hyalina]SHF15294.1 monoamine oxidase [Lampropedia hyalina DSM 16112]